MQHFHTHRVGNWRVRTILFICVFVLSGCVRVGELFYELPNGYAVSRINGHSVVLIYNENWEEETQAEWGGKFVLEKFYVKAFCHNEIYIGIMGTHTQELSASDEEISTGACCYYLLNSATGECYGPYDTEEDFEMTRNELGAGTLEPWLKVADYPDKWH